MLVNAAVWGTLLPVCQLDKHGKKLIALDPDNILPGIFNLANIYAAAGDCKRLKLFQ